MLRVLIVLMLSVAVAFAQENAGVVVAPEVVELTRRGDELLAAGLSVQAVPIYLEALAIDRDAVDAAFGLGVAYLQLAALAEALYTFDRVIALDAGRFEAHFNRALVLARSARHLEAAAGFEDALKRPSDSLRRRAAYVALGTQRWWAQDPSAAADAYAAALMLGDRDVDLELQRARALIEAGRLGEALVELAGSPARATDARIERWLAEALLRDQRPEEALLAYRRASLLEPGTPELSLAIAVLEERALRPSEVLAVLAELDAELLSESEAVAFLGLGGRAHFALGMFEQAEEWFNRLVERAPEDAAAWQWWGVSHYQLQSYEAALEAFLSAERHAPREVGVWRNLAAALTALERYAEAEGWYLRILEVHADDAHALHHLAWLRAAAGDADEAERLWLRACQLGYAPACDVR